MVFWTIPYIISACHSQVCGDCLKEMTYNPQNIQCWTSPVSILREFAYKYSIHIMTDWLTRIFRMKPSSVIIIITTTIKVEESIDRRQSKGALIFRLRIWMNTTRMLRGLCQHVGVVFSAGIWHVGRAGGGENVKLGGQPDKGHQNQPGKVTHPRGDRVENDGQASPLEQRQEASQPEAQGFTVPAKGREHRGKALRWGGRVRGAAL